MPNEKQHSINFEKNTLVVNGVEQVVEIGEKQAVFKLNNNTLTVKGVGLNVTKLDKEQGVVTLDVSSLHSLSYRSSGISLKGLFS